MRPQIVKILTLVLCFLLSARVLALQSSGSKGPPPPSDPPPPELPLDAGMLILITFGIIYGCYVTINKIRAKRTSS